MAINAWRGVGEAAWRSLKIEKAAYRGGIIVWRGDGGVAQAKAYQAEMKCV